MQTQPLRFVKIKKGLCGLAKGTLWIGTSEGGLLQFNKGTEKFIDLHDGSSTLHADHNAVNAVIEDSEGFIWIGKEDGVLSRYDHTSSSFFHFTDFKKKYPIIELLETRDGQLWIGTDKGGSFILDRNKRKFIEVYSKQESGTDVVRALFNDAKGDVWIGTYHGGAYLFDKSDTTFNHYAPYPEIKTSDESNSILSIYQEGEDLWIGTNGGGLVQKGRASTRYFKKDNSGNSITGNTIMCLTPGPGSRLYIGTYADGLSVLDRRTGKFFTYDRSNGLSDNSVYAIYRDNDFIWIGTNKGGLDLLDLKSGKFKYFTNNIKDNTTISSNTIRSIYKDSRNKLWVGTVSGLNLYNENDSTFYSFVNRTGKSNMSNINVLCIHEDAKKDLWFGTHGGGINKYDYRTDTFTAFQEKDGLGGNIVYGILEDANGNLWLSTNRGITRFNPEKKEFKNFDTKSGLASSEFNVGAYFGTRGGKMFFGSAEGVCSFFPYNIRENNYVPPVVITDFSLFNKPTGIGENSPLKKSITETTEIVLDYSQSVFSLKFSALNYSHSDKNSYAYQLEPFDKDWNFVDNTHTATYTNLDPGAYTFKVKGSNNDNVWNQTPASISIIISPPFWKTFWFRTLAIIGSILLMYGTYRFKVRSIKKQKQVLTELVAVRTSEIEQKNKLLLETEMTNAQLLNQKLNHELALKSKELTGYTLLIIQKNKLLDELKNKLRDALRNPGTENLRDFRNLLKLINQNFSSEKEWAEFHVNFNRVHQGFAESLKSRFRDLTLNDLRLCALYRVGIPSKDIAEAMGISQTSVKMARYRLRKKLGLNPEEDISEFLQYIEQKSLLGSVAVPKIENTPL
jgi:ligand-binding sensor domain-containing protein